MDVEELANELTKNKNKVNLEKLSDKFYRNEITREDLRGLHSCDNKEDFAYDVLELHGKITREREYGLGQVAKRLRDKSEPELTEEEKVGLEFVMRGDENNMYRIKRKIVRAIEQEYKPEVCALPIKSCLPESERIHGFEYKGYEEEDEEVSYYEHEDGGVIRHIWTGGGRANFVEVVDDSGSTTLGFGNVYVPTVDAAKTYDKNGQFSLNRDTEEDTNLTVSDIHEKTKLMDCYNPFNRFTISQPIASFDGLVGAQLYRFTKNIGLRPQVESNSRTNTIAEGYLKRLVCAHGYEPVMFLGETWVDYAEEEGHITMKSHSEHN